MIGTFGIHNMKHKSVFIRGRQCGKTELNVFILEKLLEAQELLDDQRVPQPHYCCIACQWYKWIDKRWTPIADINEEFIEEQD